MQFDNIQSIKEAVALGSGISILPERTMRAEVEQGRLVPYLCDAPQLLRPTGIIHRRKKKLTRAGRISESGDCARGCGGGAGAAAALIFGVRSPSCGL